MQRGSVLFYRSQQRVEWLPIEAGDRALLPPHGEVHVRTSKSISVAYEELIEGDMQQLLPLLRSSESGRSDDGLTVSCSGPSSIFSLNFC